MPYTASLLLLCVLPSLLAPARAHHPNNLTPLLARTALQASCSDALFRATPAQAEGPFYVPSPARADIAQGRAGAALRLALRVRDAGCRPVRGATVAVWQADAAGVYSGVGGVGARGVYSGKGDDFLRGQQVTGADGEVRFLTIVPGWYPGRPVHVHVKVLYAQGGKVRDLTTQLYFPMAVLEEVWKMPAYAERGDADTSTADEKTQDVLIMKNISKMVDGKGFYAGYSIGVDAALGEGDDLGNGVQSPEELEGVSPGESLEGTAGEKDEGGDIVDRVDNASDAACFLASALVRLENGSRKRMDELAIGDRVMVGPGDFSDVFAFTHRDRNVESEFVVLQLHGGRTFKSSPGHFLFVNGELKHAAAVRVGDSLTCVGAEETASCHVLSVRRSVERGLYNPQTISGSIVVDSILASTYTTAVIPAAAHGLLFGLRAWYRMFKSDGTRGLLENGSVLLVHSANALGLKKG